MRRRAAWLFLLVFLLIALASCSPAATSTSAPAAATLTPVPTKAPAVKTALPATAAPAATQVAAPTKAPEATKAAVTPAPTSSSANATQPPLPTPSAPVSPSQQPTPGEERRVIELEWPSALRLGESDLVRLSLVPYRGGYVVTAEFPEHIVEGQPLAVTHLAGYTLSGVARLDGVGFDISPGSEIAHPLPADETVTWRWTLSPKSSGQQRLSISLALHWTPDPDNPAPAKQQEAFSRGLTIQVSSVFGLSRAQAMTTGFLGLVFGAGLGAGALALRPRSARSLLRTPQPNTSLVLEPRPGIGLAGEETGLLQALVRPLRAPGAGRRIPIRILRGAHLPGPAGPSGRPGGCVHDCENWQPFFDPARGRGVRSLR